MIPFRAPFFEDPRSFSKTKLKAELKKRSLNILPNERAKIILFNLLIKETIQIKDPNLLSDIQPEKWNFMAHLAFKRSCIIEPNPNLRTECMKTTNQWIEQNIKTFDELILVAKGLSYPENESELFKQILIFSSSLMIQPTIFQDSYKSIPNKGSLGSCLIFSIVEGFTAIPDHLSI